MSSLEKRRELYGGLVTSGVLRFLDLLPFEACRASEDSCPEKTNYSQFAGDEGLHTRVTSLREAPQEQRMFRGHLPRVIYHQVF